MLSRFFCVCFAALCIVLCPFQLYTQTTSQLLDPPRQHRPAWWRDEGVVMAGAWEPLSYRLRGAGWADRDIGGIWAFDRWTNYDQKLKAWRLEHSEETARQFKDLGFNLIMIPLYKGFGLETERPGMEDAARFAEICHGLGLHVGAYVFS